MSDEKVILFRLHPCSRGLRDDELQRVAEVMDVIRCERGDAICHANEPVTSIFLVVHGRIRLELLDVHGKVVAQRFQNAGGHFGAMAAALAEPVPMNCTAEDPSVLLRMDYSKAVELSREYPTFSANYMRMIANSVKEAVFNDKTLVRPAITIFIHQSDETRAVSRMLVQRLARLGESPCFFSDKPAEMDGVHVIPIFGKDGETRPEKIQQTAAEWLAMGRVIFDVDAAVELERISSGFQASRSVLWCVTPGNWEASVGRLRTIEARASSWREKVNIVWLLHRLDSQLFPLSQS